jgi:hypothetical protein
VVRDFDRARATADEAVFPGYLQIMP